MERTKANAVYLRRKSVMVYFDVLFNNDYFVRCGCGWQCCFVQFFDFIEIMMTRVI
jgi:hypothetical protein